MPEDRIITRRELGGTVDMIYRHVGDGSDAYVPLMDTPKHRTKFENDVNGDPVYVGKAPFGAADTDPVWQIQKLVWTGGALTDILWADGDPLFDNRWDQRAGLPYS